MEIISQVSTDGIVEFARVFEDDEMIHCFGQVGVIEEMLGRMTCAVEDALLVQA